LIDERVKILTVYPFQNADMQFTCPLVILLMLIVSLY